MKLKKTGEIEFSMPEPFSFELTVNKPAGWHWSTPAETFEKGVFWSGVRLEYRPIGLKMHAEGSKVLTAVYASSKLSANSLGALEADLRQALGGDEDIAGFYKFALGEPSLKHAVEHLYGMRLGRPRDLFGRVILATCLQMAPLKRSRQMMDLILSGFGTTISFDGHEVILWPTAKDIAAINPGTLREKAKLGYRAERLLAAAKFLGENPILFDRLDSLPEGEARRVVMTIPGIGEYSAGIVLGRGEVPVDSWSVTILSELIFDKREKESRKDIPALSGTINRRWGRWGWLAFAYIVNDLPHLAEMYKLSRVY